ncbi:oxygen-independent coproporphyrinogen III oxidase [Coraliomargarita algicola]|uniref:Coproporphyrinogen-III oxidase n=1 Tax=Coraliomargarita algicola TaxID=3092156 RepID=A0ABZ0RQ84_9BACT|nr:oxygen-independent coproporphyrinogen III oxidase [Coraliomargarita sp. J2-16]WPJ97677.1 oxygen-independent coproporphyrinogen III oxidase [Coraliomargarita sp. J2-16]
MQITSQDLRLIEKYNRPGPRYTSYPPANHFREYEDYTPLMAGVEDGDAPLSLYFHLPFCETLCWFCGCHQITTLDRNRGSDYLDLLERELEIFAQHLPAGREAVQMHFGGGTPNFFTSAQIDRLASMIDRHFTFSHDAEKSVELDPRRLNREHVEAFARMGLTRASFGVQDSNPEVQKVIHRLQPQAMNVEAMQMLRDNGFNSVNLDLIYGLPLQTCDSFSATLDEVLELKPDRFAIFNYAHVPWMRPAQKLLEKAGLPDAETKMQLLKLCIERLTAEGYVYIGMDHFALPDDELVQAQREQSLQRNFQGYSTRAGVEICGFGISSISQGSIGFHQNMKDLESYRACLSQGKLPITKGYELTDEDRMRADVIMRLMCDLSLDFGAMSEKWNVNFESHFAEALKQLAEPAEDGLLVWTDRGFAVTERGRLFIRNLAMCFDAYLDPAVAGRYSKTV